MEGEIYNFIWVWMAILASLFICHTIIGNKIPQGTPKLLALTPIICLFFYLPLNLTSMHLGCFTYFFITWLANFKLLLFAYGKPPLSNPSNPSLPIPLTHFISVACVPILIVNNPSSQNSKQIIPKKKPLVSPINYAFKVTMALISSLIIVSNKHLYPKLRMSIYCVQIYFALDIVLATFAILTQTLVSVELEPQFDKPHLATSVQNFYGKRWNLMVRNILSNAVYNPLKEVLLRSKIIPKKWASLPPVFVTFLVSGLMHEVIFYYIGRLRPTGIVACFFILQGIMVDIEIVIKKKVDGKFKLNPIVSRIYTLGFVICTCFFFFFPPFLMMNVEAKGCREIVAFVESVRHGKLISPFGLSCPFDI